MRLVEGNMAHFKIPYLRIVIVAWLLYFSSLCLPVFPEIFGRGGIIYGWEILGNIPLRFVEVLGGSGLDWATVIGVLMVLLVNIEIIMPVVMGGFRRSKLLDRISVAVSLACFAAPVTFFVLLLVDKQISNVYIGAYHWAASLGLIAIWSILSLRRPWP